MTADDAYSLLDYNPVTGQFRKRATGLVTGTTNAAGYVVIRLRNKLHYAHRLAWLLCTGEWPSLIDHINRNRSDNRFTNLRSATSSLNAQNKTPTPTRVHGLPSGAHFHKPSGGYKSAIRVADKQIHLGYFKTAEEAAAAYAEAKRIHHKGALDA